VGGSRLLSHIGVNQIMNIEKRAAFGLTFVIAKNPVWFFLGGIGACVITHKFLNIVDVAGVAFVATLILMPIILGISITRYVIAPVLAMHLERKIFNKYGPKTVAMAYKWLEGDSKTYFSFSDAAAECGEG
jgi:uncharacterized membrane protein YdcZ (DUF606 family)